MEYSGSANGWAEGRPEVVVGAVLEVNLVPSLQAQSDGTDESLNPETGVDIERACCRWLRL